MSNRYEERGSSTSYRPYASSSSSLHHASGDTRQYRSFDRHPTHSYSHASFANVDAGPETSSSYLCEPSGASETAARRREHCYDEGESPPRLLKRRSGTDTLTSEHPSSTFELPVPLMQQPGHSISGVRHSVIPARSKVNTASSSRASTRTSPSLDTHQDDSVLPINPVKRSAARSSQSTLNTRPEGLREDDIGDLIMEPLGQWFDARKSRTEREQELRRFQDILQHRPDAGKVVEDKIKGAKQQVEVAKQRELQHERDASRAFTRVLHISARPLVESSSTVSAPTTAQESVSSKLVQAPEVTVERVKRLFDELFDRKMLKAKAKFLSEREKSLEPGELPEPLAPELSIGDMASQVETETEASQREVSIAEVTSNRKDGMSDEVRQRARKIVPSRNEIVRRIEEFDVRLEDVRSELCERLDEYDFLNLENMVEAAVAEKIKTVRHLRRASKRKREDIEEGEALNVPDGVRSTTNEDEAGQRSRTSPTNPSKSISGKQSQFVANIAADTPDEQALVSATQVATELIDSSAEKAKEEALANLSSAASGSTRTASSALDFNSQNTPLHPSTTITDEALNKALQMINSDCQQKIMGALWQQEQKTTAMQFAAQQAFEHRFKYYEGMIKELQERIYTLASQLNEARQVSNQVASSHESALIEHANCIVELDRKQRNTEAAFAMIPVAHHPKLEQMLSQAPANGTRSIAGDPENAQYPRLDHSRPQ